MRDGNCYIGLFIPPNLEGPRFNPAPHLILHGLLIDPFKP